MAHVHDHAHGEGDHDHPGHGEEDRRIRVLHAASPFCHWSYGYEPVLRRLRLLYGDQVKVNTYQVPVYESFEQWMRDYELDDAGLAAWMEEARQLMRVPVNMDYFRHPTQNCVPGTLVLHAAELASPGAGERYPRLVWHAMSVEGRNLDDEAQLLALAEGAGAPRKEVESALHDGRAEAAMRQDAQDMHVLGLNFYALQVRDFEGRTVILEHAFDAPKVEEAVEWLGRGTVRPRALPPPADYVAEHAPVSLRELTEVFRLDEAAARRAVEPAERARRVVRRDLLGHPFWLPP